MSEPDSNDEALVLLDETARQLTQTQGPIAALVYSLAAWTRCTAPLLEREIQKDVRARGITRQVDPWLLHVEILAFFVAVLGQFARDIVSPQVGAQVRRALIGNVSGGALMQLCRWNFPAADSSTLGGYYNGAAETADQATHDYESCVSVVGHEGTSPFDDKTMLGKLCKRIGHLIAPLSPVGLTATAVGVNVVLTHSGPASLIGQVRPTVIAISELPGLGLG